MTNFRTCLETICSGIGAGVIAASLMGVDGLPVESVEAGTALNDAGEPVDIGSLLVEYSSVLGQVKRSAQVFAAGGLEEVTIRSERLTTIIRTITEDYFLALALLPNANFGKGRYLLRVHAPSLVSDLS